MPGSVVGSVHGNSELCCCVSILMPNVKLGGLEVGVVKQAFGIVCIVFCILAGSFITVISVTALVDGEEDPILFGYISGGVVLMFTGLFIMHRMTRSSVEPIETEDQEEEDW